MATKFDDGDFPFEVGHAVPLRATDKAVLMDLDTGHRLWIPKSAIHDDSDVWTHPQEAGTLVVMTWFAQGQGWAGRKG
jgi:hypothetical protein